MVRLTPRIQALRLFHVEQARPVRRQTAKQEACQPIRVRTRTSKLRTNNLPGTGLASARRVPHTYWYGPCLSKTRARSRRSMVGTKQEACQLPPGAGKPSSTIRCLAGGPV